MSSRLDWEITRGDTDTLAFVVSYLVGAVWLTDITGAEVRFTARLRGSPVLFKRNITAGGSAAEVEITDASAGKVEVYLVATDLPVDVIGSSASVVLDYDLEVLLVNGQKRTMAIGVLRVTMDQTR